MGPDTITIAAPNGWKCNMCNVVWSTVNDFCCHKSGGCVVCPSCGSRRVLIPAACLAILGQDDDLRGAFVLVAVVAGCGPQEAVETASDGTDPWPIYAYHRELIQAGFSKMQASKMLGCANIPVRPERMVLWRTPDG